MHVHVSLLGIALLPLLAGAIVLGCAPLWRRWFGAERATALAGRFALGGTLLAGFLIAAAIYAIRVRPDLDPSQPVLWARVGFTTVLGLDLEIDGLTVVVAGQALIVALAAMLAGLVARGGGAAALGRAAVLLGSTLLLTMGATVWACALAWQIAMLVAGGAGQGAKDRSEGAGPEGQGAEDRSEGTGDWARATDAGVWLAALATATGTGDLALALVTRGALLGEHAGMVTRGLASVAAIGLAVAVIGRALGFAGAVRGEGPATRAALHGLAATAGALLLLRMHMVLALAPTVMAGLALAGGVLAAWAGQAAARASGRAEALARVSQAHVGLMIVACGMGAWVPACGLIVAHGLASAGLVLGGERRAVRWIGGLGLGMVPLAAGLWIGEIAGAGFVSMSAWSPAINFVVAGLALVAAVGLGGAIGQVVRDRWGASTAASDGLEVGLGGVLVVLALAVAAIDAPGAVDGLRVWLGPVFGASRLLAGQFAIGARPGYSLVLWGWGAMSVIAAAMIVASWIGWLWLRAPRAWPAWTIAGDGPRRRWRDACRGVHALIELRLLGALLRSGEVQAVRAGGPPETGRAVLGVLAGAAVLLGAVYCNPDVAQVGPSRVYPVDAGGLDPALLGSRRPGEEAP